MKLKVPPGGIVPLSKAPLSLVTVCGADVLFFHITVVPTAIVDAGGLKLKPPLLTIVTVMVVGAGVGLGLGLGVGVGVVLVAVGVGFALVGVGLGFACVGVALACVDVGEGVVAVTPEVAVSVLADEGAFVVAALLPPHPVSTIMKASMQTPHKARRRGK